MAKTPNLQLPLDTQGTVALKQTVEAGFKKLDTVVKALQDGDAAYDNSDSDLTATTVKAAIDELAARVAALE